MKRQVWSGIALLIGLRGGENSLSPIYRVCTAAVCGCVCTSYFTVERKRLRAARVPLSLGCSTTSVAQNADKTITSR